MHSSAIVATTLMYTGGDIRSVRESWLPCNVMDIMDIDPRDTEDDFLHVLHKDIPCLKFTVHLNALQIFHTASFVMTLSTIIFSGHNNSWYMVNFTELFYDNE